MTDAVYRNELKQKTGVFLSHDAWRHILLKCSMTKRKTRHKQNRLFYLKKQIRDPMASGEESLEEERKHGERTRV